MSGRRPAPVVACAVVLAAAVAWGALAGLALFAGIWAIFLNTVHYTDQPIQSPIMFFPLPAFLLLMLYWVRWWAVAPPTVWYDLLDGR